MWCHFAIVSVVILPLVCPIQIHKDMTNEEVLRTFKTNHDSVPEYEVVPVFHKFYKSYNDEEITATVKINAFNRDISLYLEPTDGLLAGIHTPVWTVVSDPGWPEGIKYRRERNPFRNIGQTYQDPSKMAAIVAYEVDGDNTVISGNLVSDLIVQPLPDRLRHAVLRQTRSLNDKLLNKTMDEQGFRRTHHHVVFKRHEPIASSVDNGIKIIKRYETSARDIANTGITNETMPDIIYPEILVTVDYNLYSVLGKNVKETTRYVLAFWNAVDLRYRLLEEPRVRLNIAGIIVSMELGGTPYLESSRRGNEQLDSDLAITAMSHYFYRDSYRFPFSTYDMAVAMTRLDMCNVEHNGICNPSTLGYAYEWGACNRSHVDTNTEAVGIVEDNGGYSGIIPAAHEVAHLMGAPHDGTNETPGCPSWNGYIMSAALSLREGGFQWSTCSLKALYDFFSLPDSSCIFNKPKPDHPVRPSMLPGKLLTIDEQCEKVFGTRACYHDESVCTRLECYVSHRSNECRAVSAAAEGSACGNAMHCINGYCVDENSTIVPYPITRTSGTLYPPEMFGPRVIFSNDA